MAPCIQFFVQLHVTQGRKKLRPSLEEEIKVEGNDVTVGIKLDKSILGNLDAVSPSQCVQSQAKTVAPLPS